MPQPSVEAKDDKVMEPQTIAMDRGSYDFYNYTGLITKNFEGLEQNRQLHFWSYGNFNMMRLVFWILEQTGPSEILMCTYSISPKSLQSVIRRREEGLIKNIRFLVDSRVRSLSPKPFDMMVRSFDYRCISIHAKVALIWNNHWKVTVVSSQNATDNPKMERGVIYTTDDVFNFDKNVLEDAFNRGTT